MSERRIYYSREAEMRARRSGAGIALLAMVLGVTAGIAVALLFAPRSGEEIREELARSAGGFLEGAKQTGESVATQAGRAVDQVRERIEERINHA